MIHEQDWLMREIESFINLIARVAFKKDKIKYSIIDEESLSASDVLYKKLMALLEKHEICEAEDMLFNEIDEKDESFIELILDFYQQINALSDEELAASNFSREEVVEGIAAALKKYGVDYVVPPEI